MPLHVQASDLVIVGTLVILEGLLSADNALVLALLVRHLPEQQQRKALLYGLVGAFTLRGLFIFLAKAIMNLWWVCGIGSLYLIFLAIKHFLRRDHHDDGDGEDGKPKKKGMGFWQTVAVVEMTDIFFAIDSILVAVALVNDPKKVWIVYTGGFLGIVLLRLAAGFFIRLITKYPTLDNMAYALVGWAGVKLASASVDVWALSNGRPAPHLLPKWAFWVGFVVILAIGSFLAVRHKPDAGDEAERAENEELLDSLEDGGFLPDEDKGRSGSTGGAER